MKLTRKSLFIILLGMICAGGIILPACSLRKGKATPTPKPSPTALVTATPATSGTSTPNYAYPTSPLVTLPENKLIVLTAAVLQPWEFMDENNVLAGFDIDLIQEIGKRAGLTVEIQNMDDFEKVLPALQEGKAHVAIAAIQPTIPRQKLFDFTTSYYQTQQAVIAIMSSTITMKEATEVANYRLGVVTDTPLDAWVINSLITPGLLPIKNLNRYQSVEQLTEALLGERIQVGLVDANLAQFYQDEGLARILVVQRISGNGPAIAIRKSKDVGDLKKVFDQILGQMESDGYLPKLREKWSIR